MTSQIKPWDVPVFLLLMPIEIENIILVSSKSSYGNFSIWHVEVMKYMMRAWFFLAFWSLRWHCAIDEKQDRRRQPHVENSDFFHNALCGEENGRHSQERHAREIMTTKGF